MKVEIVYDSSKNIIPCIEVVPYASILFNEELNNCDTQITASGLYVINIENPQLSMWYIQVGFTFSKIYEIFFNFISYKDSRIFSRILRFQSI